MLAHYLAVALAKFRKTPLTTAANVLTLALGLACFIAAYGIATYWRSADGYHPNAERIFVVGQVNRALGQVDVGSGRQQSAVPLTSISSWHLGPALREEFPQLEAVARALAEADIPAAAGEAKAILDVAVVDPAFLDLFDFTFIAGDPARALDSPGSVVLTDATARRLFGDAPALGRSLLLNGDEEVTVTGVIAPVRQPSFMGAGQDATLRFDLLRDWSSSATAAQLEAVPSWRGIYPITVVRLPPTLSSEAFEAQLPAMLERRLPEADRAAAETILQPFPISELSSFTLNAALLASSGAGVTAVGVLFGLAALILLVACVNYANLATAQSASRGKEIGMRRVLGAGRAQVMAQTWIEASLLTLAAVVAALAAVALAAPAVQAATGIDLRFFLTQGLAPFAVLAALVAGVALFAGVYPALVQSRVRPAETLRTSRSRSGSRLVTRVLVGVQFASASFLLILLTVTQLQRDHLERSALAPRQDPIVVLNDLKSIGVDYDTLAARLSGRPGIQSVSVVDHMPWGLSMNGAPFARTADPQASSALAFMKSVGHGYFQTLNLGVVAGRVFESGRDSAPNYADPSVIPSIVIDRRYAEALGFATPEEAVGAAVYIPARYAGGVARSAEIIGVTETEWTRLGLAGAGSAYALGAISPFGQQLPIVRLARDDVAAGVASIDAVWDELAPTVAVDVRFFDDLFEQSFRTYARVSWIFGLLAGASFLIASIGQLGLAVHVAARRRHEIGVRKTLGSTTLGIIRLLLVDFSKPILVANLIAWPIAFMAAQIYLQSFDNRVALTPAPFALSLALTLAIAWAAVIGEVLKAASVRPAEVLRHA